MPQDKHNERDNMGSGCGSKGKEEKGQSMKNIREPEVKYERTSVAQKEKPRAKDQEEQDEDEGEYCTP